uniref:Zinc finger, CCHC-type n=1 Tax=Tanacetum cinerariifolium TaxID=118510 RepID=A0A6L2MUV2_TANCI|nr:zinc finger, CCHC-type [Tanacetum cinerariifolium]
MDEGIKVSCIIDKLPPSWKYFKHTLKHKKEELTHIKLGSHLRIEESFSVEDNDKPNGNNIDHGVKSSQNPPPIDECCCECGNTLDGIFCQQCICKSCGKGAHIGYNCPPKVPVISNPEPCNQTINTELPQTLPSFDSAPCISKPNFIDEPSNIFNPPLQHPVYPCEFCGNDAYFGHYCIPKAQINNPEQGYSQDFNFPKNIHNFQQQYLCPHENFQCQPVNYCEPDPSYGSYYPGYDQVGDSHPQQYLCCENCGGPHETFQCQPTNEDYCYEQNSCCYSNSFGFDHCQTPQYTVDHPIFDAHNDLLKTQNELLTSQNTIMEQMTQLTSMCEMFCQIVQKKQEEKRIEEEQAANARYWKIPACCDDDDDYDSAITPILSTNNILVVKIVSSRTTLMKQMTQLTSICKMFCQFIQKKQEEKQIEEEQAAKAQNSKIPVCYDNDDDYNLSITPNEPVASLSMGDEHLNTIPATESDEFIKSSVENLVPNPSESEDENGCDMPACFTTFSNVLFDAEYEFDSSDDQSLSDEDFPEKIFSNPLFKEEIISTKIDPHHFDVVFDVIESMLNHDSSIISSSSKIDSLLDEFAGELILLKSIPSGIDETDCDPEDEIRFIKRLLYDNSSSRPLEEFVSKNSNADIKSFSPSPIPVEDSDSFMKEIDLSFNPDDPMPPSIEEDDDDSERDILINEELLDNYSLSLFVNESFHFDIPLFSRPTAKPPGGIKCFPKAGGLQPKSNHKTNRISPTKGDNKLHIEDLPRTNKSHLRTMNRVDSNSRLKHNPSANPTFSSHPKLASPKVKDDIFDPEGGNVLPEKLLDLDSTKDLHPSHHFDIESNLKEIEYLLHHDPIKDIDSILKDLIDQSNLVDLNDNLVDSMPEMFTDEHALDYSSPPLYDENDDDLVEVESDTENVYDDPFDFKGEKIKESKLLINELDLPCDFLLPSEYDSFLSEDFSKVDAFPSTNNEDKVFNLGILIQENLFEIITRVAQDKKLAISHASLMIEDCDPPLYELPFFKKVPRSKILLLFSSENEKKVFKPRIHTSEKVHSSLIIELSHQGYKVFKINQIFKSPMKNFLFSYRKDTHILDVPCLHFYPFDQFKYGGIGSS